MAADVLVIVAVVRPCEFKNALNQMHATLNKHHKESPPRSRKPHHLFCQEIRKIKVIKCPPNSFPQGHINSNPKLKDNPYTKANPKVTMRWFMLRHFTTLIKIDHASNCAFLDTNGLCSFVLLV